MVNTRPGKLTKNYGTSPFLMGKSTISMAMFNSFLYVYQAGYLDEFDHDQKRRDITGITGKL